MKYDLRFNLCVHALSHSVMSDSLVTPWIVPSRLFHPRNSARILGLPSVVAGVMPHIVSLDLISLTLLTLRLIAWLPFRFG